MTLDEMTDLDKIELQVRAGGRHTTESPNPDYPQTPQAHGYCRMPVAVEQ